MTNEYRNGDTVPHRNLLLRLLVPGWLNCTKSKVTKNIFMKYPCLFIKERYKSTTYVFTTPEHKLLHLRLPIFSYATKVTFLGLFTLKACKCLNKCLFIYFTVSVQSYYTIIKIVFVYEMAVNIKNNWSLVIWGRFVKRVKTGKI